MNYQFEYVINNVSYKVNVTKKLLRNINFRFKNGEFYVSAHPLISKARIISGLDKYGESLLKRSVKNYPIGENYIYIFGDKYPLENEGVISLNNGMDIAYKSKEDLEKKLKFLLKEFVTTKVEEHSKVMGTCEYKVRVQKMTSRYGSNSKATSTLNFATLLIHYSYNIIESVVVHELSHYFAYDHSDRFYNVVYKYCPNYNYLHKCLRKGVFHD